MDDIVLDNGLWCVSPSCLMRGGWQVLILVAIARTAGAVAFSVVGTSAFCGITGARQLAIFFDRLY